MALFMFLSSTAFAPDPVQQQPVQEAVAVPAAPPQASGSGNDATGDDDWDEDDEIVVSGARPRGAVVTNIAPEVQLGSRAIRALGTSNLDEILEELAPQTRSLRGGQEPVVLLNGQRISSFAEIRDLPPEAIHRIDIFPEEVALQYGYSAQQRVVNVVLRRRYKAIGLQGRYALAGERGRTIYRGKVNILRLTPEGRWNLDLLYRHENPVFETDDGSGGPGGDGARTLVPKTDQFSANGAINRKLGDISATVNGRFELNRKESQFGLVRNLADELEPAGRVVNEREAHGGLTLNGELSTWRWTFTGNYDADRQKVRTDGPDGVSAGRNSTSNSYRRGADLLTNGKLFALPAGDVATAVGIGFESRNLRVRQDGGDPSDTDRETAHSQASLEIPIASRRDGFLRELGELSANVNGQVDRLSDFGTLTKFGYGLRWAPIEAVTFVASMSHDENAPGIDLLGNATLRTPNVRFYDFPAGASVSATRIEGGNPDLDPEKRRSLDLRLQVQPIPKLDLGLSIAYSNSLTREAISGQLGATPQVEFALPQRFARDGDGTLLSFDRRPTNFDEWRREQLRWGFNFSKPIGAPSAKQSVQQLVAAAGAETTAESTEGEPANASALPMAEKEVPKRFRPRQGQLQFAFYHTWHLKDEVLVREGLPRLNLLEGDAIRARGGQPRHEFELQAGVAARGLGVRIATNWQTRTVVRDMLPTSSGSANKLIFSESPKVDLRLFIDLGAQRWLSGIPWLRGRVNFAMDNVFNAHSRVRDVNGEAVSGYERSANETLGRSFRITLRKIFRSR